MLSIDPSIDVNIACALLEWPHRRAKRLRKIDLKRDSEIVAAFCDHLLNLDRRLHREDIAFAVQRYLKPDRDTARENSGFEAWYGSLLVPFEDCLRFEGGEPHLAAGVSTDGILTRWRRITARVDPDALIALRLARYAPEHSPDKILEYLKHWPYFIGLRDHGLDTVLARGLADTHVHFEASDPIAVLWWRVATGRVGAEPRHLVYFSEATMVKLERSDGEAHRVRLADRLELEKLPLLRGRLLHALGLSPPPLSQVEPKQVMADERRLLIAAWQKICRDAPNDLVDDFDNYLSIKNRFLQLHEQKAGEGAGLDRFRDFLDRGETSWEKRNKKSRPAVRRMRFERMLSLATEPRHLKVLELRIAPQKEKGGWERFFRLWEEKFLKNLTARGIEVRFVVHFIRDVSPKMVAPTSSVPMHFGRLRQVLDLQSAILQLFRHERETLARHIVGIDVANLERGCPPELMAPYLQLLRGDPQALGQDFDHPALEKWRRLSYGRKHVVPLRLPRLGLTYHAGEDFYHVADGLRHIDGLLTHLLEPGDRIGHGLVVGVEPEAWSKTRGSVAMPAGVLLDSLVWLRREGRRLGHWSGELRGLAETTTNDLCRKIYGEVQDPDTLERALEARYRMPLMPRRDTSDLVPREDRLVSREAFDEKAWDERRRLCSPEECRALDHAMPLLKDLQRTLARAIRDRGVVVEINPTSNLVTQTVTSLSSHPFLRYRETLEGQVVTTINTDDPGVFGTNLTVEFGLVFEALQKYGLNRVETLQVLESCRRLAMDHAFGQEWRKSRQDGSDPGLGLDLAYKVDRSIA